MASVMNLPKQLPGGWDFSDIEASALVASRSIKAIIAIQVIINFYVGGNIDILWRMLLVL